MSVAAAQASYKLEVKEGFQVLNDQILIRPEKEESGLIWMPSDPHKRTRTGTIIAMGPGMKVEGRGKVRHKKRVLVWKGPVDAFGYNVYPMPEVHIGDRVMYLTWSLNVVSIDKVEHHLVRDTAIELRFLTDTEKGKADDVTGSPARP